MVGHQGPSITLVVPGLLGTMATYRQFQGLSYEHENLKPLEKLLTRARKVRLDTFGLEPTLFSLFSIPQAKDQDFPTASLSLYGDSGELPAGYWLRADPVYLQADRDCVLMTATGRQTLSSDAVYGFVEELNHFLEPLGMQLDAPVPQRWYLHLPGKPQMRTSPVNKAIGHDIHAHMPQGEDAQQWRVLLNEIQMVLHASEINQRLQENSQVPVNSLWFWGGGSLPDSPGKNWDCVWGDDALIKGLSLLSGAEHELLPDNADLWMAHQPRMGKHLVVYDGLISAAQSCDFDTWIRRLGEFSIQWCKPLLQALKSRRITSVAICPANGMSYQITAKELGHWWKRRGHLISYLDRNDNLYD